MPCTLTSDRRHSYPRPGPDSASSNGAAIDFQDFTPSTDALRGASARSHGVASIERRGPGLVPQHSEDLRPALSRASKGDAATLEFTAFGRDFRLQLSNNQRLAQFAAGSSVQLYKGALEGVPGSWARISVHDGLPRGMIWDGRELFVVDAAPEAVNYGAAGTVMFKLSDAVLERGVSFAGDAVEKPGDPAAAYGALIGELRARTQALKDGVATERVEISILGDAAYLARYASEAQARDAILTRLNSVDGIFSSQLGVELQVVSVISPVNSRQPVRDHRFERADRRVGTVATADPGAFRHRPHASVHRPPARRRHRRRRLSLGALQPALCRQSHHGAQQRRAGYAHHRTRDRPCVRRPARWHGTMCLHAARPIHHDADDRHVDHILLPMQSRPDQRGDRQLLLRGGAASVCPGATRTGPFGSAFR